MTLLQYQINCRNPPIAAQVWLGINDESETYEPWFRYWKVFRPIFLVVRLIFGENVLVLQLFWACSSRDSTAHIKSAKPYDITRNS